MTLQEQLAEAEQKYHQLVTGGQPVSMTREGRSITFEPADQDRLLSYIERLRSQLGSPSLRRGRPARVC